jgi:amino acid adenylation domain-containing protein
VDLSTDDDVREIDSAARPATVSTVDSTLHARFREQAARTPDGVALRFGGESITYAEVDARSDALARRLRRRGVGPETRVGLCVERSPETVVGILGILKAGGAYVPLDPDYPAERLAWLLEDSRAPVVVTTAALAAKVSAGGPAVVRIDEHADEVADEDLSAVRVSPDGLAYVIYTSGSTGRPKGVEVTHANVLRLFQSTDAWFGFGAGDVWTLFHSYAFDFSVWEIWGALLHGGRLVLVPWLASRAPDDFHALLRRERVTVLNQTPSAFRQLAFADEAAAERGEPGLALRLVVFGGEALDPTTLRGWIERHGDKAPRLVNMYGITETTVHVTFREIRREDALGSAAR